MTPKEKAKELIDKFTPHTRVFHEVLGWEDYLDSAKKCALIAVDEIMNNTIGQGSSGIEVYQEEIYSDIEYWDKVKQEIEKLQ